MGGRFSQTHGWDHSGRTMERNFLFCLEQGDCLFTVGENRMKLTPGDILIVPRDTFYAPVTQEGCTYVYLHFDADIQSVSHPPAGKSHHYCEQITAGPMLLGLPECFQADSSIRLYLDVILSELTRNTPVSYARMNLTFLQLLLHAAEKVQTGGTLAHEIEAFLMAHLSSPVTLDMLSGHFGYTKQYLIRVFRAQFGVPPMVYLNDARLSHGLRCLMETGLSVEEAAHRCGFEDSNYFSRLFKKKYQLPPSVYRRKAAGI